MKTTGKPRKPKTEPPIFDADGFQTNIKDLNGTPLPDLSKVQAVSFWGGTPQGAGRKTTRRQPFFLRLTPKTLRPPPAAPPQQGKYIPGVAETRSAPPLIP